jgi:adhesin transport system outer membrane protein
VSDSVSLALSSHPQLQAQKATVAAAADNVRAQKSSFFPVLSIDGAAGRLNENDDTTRANTGGYASSWKGQGSVTLTEPVFAGFGNVNRLSAARDRQQSALYDLNGSADSVALKAARAHLNLMRTKELLMLAADYMNKIQERKDSIALMVKEGAAGESDLLQANDILMAARTTRLGYEESFRQARADYIEAVGAPPGKILDIGLPTWNAIIPPTEEAAVAMADHNPAVQSARQMVSALSKDAAAEKGSLLPKVNAEVSYFGMDQHDELGGEQNTAQAMLRMSWDFATGGAQFANIDKKLSERRAADARRAETLRMAQHDVRQKYTAMKIVDQQYALLGDREEAGKKLLNSYLAQFEGGKQTNLQIISANARLFDARAAHTDAYYRRLLSRFELLQAMGELRNAFSSIPAESHVAQAAPDREK